VNPRAAAVSAENGWICPAFSFSASGSRAAAVSAGNGRICLAFSFSALLSPSLPFSTGCHNHRYLQTRKKKKQEERNKQ
jgi:hypothetical protein